MLPRLGSQFRRNGIAYLALFFALSGTAVAARGALITGDQIQDGSLTGADVRDDSLEGADIDESNLDIVETSLGKVGDADTLDGKDSTDLLSRGFFVNRREQLRFSETTPAVPLVKLLPPGKYLISASLDIASGDSDDEPIVVCQLRQGTTVLYRSQRSLAGTFDPGQTQGVTLQAAVDGDAQIGVEVSCSVASRGDATILEAALSAIKVDSIG